MAGTSVRRYAQALLNIVGDPEDLERVETDLVSAHRILAELPALGRVLVNPAVPDGQRKELLDGLFDKLEAHPASRGIVTLMVEQREVSQLGEMLASFKRMKDSKLGVTTVEVISAMEIELADREAWKSALAKVAGTPVRIDFTKDSSLVGGAIARIGSVLYDGSVRGSLERIRLGLRGD